MELAEVYRVIYDGPDDYLRGIIVCNDEQNGYQYLFKDGVEEDNDIRDIMSKCDTFEGYNKDTDKQLDLTSKPRIRSLDHIIPNAPINSSIRAKAGFSISLYMFGAVYENLAFKYPYEKPEKLDVPRTKYFMSRDGFRHLQVLYAIFENAVEAHLKISLTSKYKSDIYGVIAARTSAITKPAYSSIIFCKRPDEKIKVGDEDDLIIPLSRDIIAVPLGHQLILQLGLNGSGNDDNLEDDNVRIVQRTLVIVVSEEGTHMEHISCDKVDLKVEVSWSCTSHKPPMTTH